MTSFGTARLTRFEVLDADEVAPNIFQASIPTRGTLLRDHGFDVVVLCASSYQPPASEFPGVHVIHAPNEDEQDWPPPKFRLQEAMRAAKEVAALVKQGKRALITCQAGLNRSGLVSALVIHLIYGWSGERCVRQVQKRREDALFNRQFVAILNRIKAKDPAWTHQTKL